MARSALSLVILALVASSALAVPLPTRLPYRTAAAAKAALPKYPVAKAVPKYPVAKVVPKAVAKVAAAPIAAVAAAPAAAVAAGAPVAAGPVKASLDCTPWSGDLCVPTPGEPGLSTVGVNAAGGGGMQSPQHYINGIFSLDMKLPAGYSGGVNFAWYTMDTVSPTNKDLKHSEIDIEFYGNQTQADVMLALNVFANGKQNLAQFKMPFDVSEVHTYSIKWGPTQIVWLVDGTPIRILNKEAGKPWPMHAMKPMASVWATPWTPLQPNYDNGPVTAQYGNYKAVGCLVTDEEAVQQLPIQCPGPWNNPLTPAQMAAYQKFKVNQIVDYGWDNI